MEGPLDLKRRLLTNEKFIFWVKNPSPESDHFWSWWLERYPEHLEMFYEAQEMVRLMEFKPAYPSELQIRQMKASYQERIAVGQRSGSFSYIWHVAAVLVLGLFVYLYMKSDINAIERIETLKGQKLSVILPDDSRVWLNGGSVLQYRLSDFSGTGERMVSLNGEGFFDVARDESKPFIVKTPSLDIKVLGTSFNVRSYGDDQTVETVLVEGKVAIRSSEGENQGEHVLIPNQIAVYEKSSDQMVIRQVNAEKSTSWKSGVLIIEDESFHDMARKLERWYGVEVEVVNGGDCHVSVKIEGETLKEILEALKLTSRVKYTIKNDKILITVTC